MRITMSVSFISSHLCEYGGLNDLLDKYHLVDEIACSADLLDCKEDIAYIERDVPADFRVKYDVAHCSFPYAVEVEADQISVLIDDRTS